MAFPVPSSQSSSGVNGTVTVAALTGLAVGDLMVAQVAARSDTTTGINPPSGWTQTHSYAPGNNSICTFTKTAVLADLGATFTFTSSFSASNTNAMTAVVTRVTGVDPTTPILTSSYTDDAGTSTAPTGTAINPAKNVLFLLLVSGTTATGTGESITGFAVANNNPSWTSQANVSRVNGVSGANAFTGAGSANQGALGTTGTASAALSVARQNVSVAFLGIQGPVTFIATIFGARFVVPQPIVPVITAIFGARFFVPAVTVNIIAAVWNFLSKGTTLPSDWTNTPKSN